MAELDVRAQLTFANVLGELMKIGPGDKNGRFATGDHQALKRRVACNGIQRGPELFQSCLVEEISGRTVSIKPQLANSLRRHFEVYKFAHSLQSKAKSSA